MFCIQVEYMIQIKKVLLVFLLCVSTSSFAFASEMSVSHTDADWNNGEGKVPKIGICKARKVGGKGMSPSIQVDGLPMGTVLLELYFTDEDWNSEGAHGVVSYKVSSGEQSLVIPSFKGETNNLPQNFKAISKHKARKLSDGIYLGPCSGGKGHTYVVYIYAKDKKGKKLAKAKLSLGKY